MLGMIGRDKYDALGRSKLCLRLNLNRRKFYRALFYITRPQSEVYILYVSSEALKVSCKVYAMFNCYCMMLHSYYIESFMLVNQLQDHKSMLNTWSVQFCNPKLLVLKAKVIVTFLQNVEA